MNTINDVKCNAEQAEEIMVACGICLREVPESEARNGEATDYVIHFCGLECYAEWRKQSADKGRQEPGKL